MQTGLVLQRKLLPGWTVQLLVGTLLLAPLLVLVDALARLRRRRMPVGRWTLWTLILRAAVPAVCAASPSCSGAPRPHPGAAPRVLVLPRRDALRWHRRRAAGRGGRSRSCWRGCGWAALLRRRGWAVRPDPEVAGLSMLLVLSPSACSCGSPTPTRRCCCVPALHLWLLLASPELRPAAARIGGARRRSGSRRSGCCSPSTRTSSASGRAMSPGRPCCCSPAAAWARRSGAVEPRARLRGGGRDARARRPDAPPGRAGCRRLRGDHDPRPAHLRRTGIARRNRVGAPAMTAVSDLPLTAPLRPSRPAADRPGASARGAAARCGLLAVRADPRGHARAARRRRDARVAGADLGALREDSSRITSRRPAARRTRAAHRRPSGARSRASPTSAARSRSSPGELERRTADGGAVGRIVIPRIGVSFVVVKGTSTEDLESGPGRLSRNGLPGSRAHDGDRRAPHDLPGALPPHRRARATASRIRLQMPYAEFTYSVIGQRVVEPTDVQAAVARPSATTGSCSPRARLCSAPPNGCSCSRTSCAPCPAVRRASCPAALVARPIEAHARCAARRPGAGPRHLPPVLEPLDPRLLSPLV